MATRHCCRTVPKRIAKRTPLYSTKLCWTNRRVRSVMTITDEPQIRALFNSSGSLAILAAILRAFSEISGAPLPTDRGHLLLANTPICSQSLKGKIVEVLVNPRGLSVDVLNDDRKKKSRQPRYVSLTEAAPTDQGDGKRRAGISQFHCRKIAA